MGTTNVRELHLKTSALIKNVARGESYIIESRGVPVAELRPIQDAPRGARLPDREAFIRRLKKDTSDAGNILEEDRL
ncbi:MAG: hypothetical protein ABL995_16350 [Bryobacteraceae bacterium]